MTGLHIYACPVNVSVMPRSGSSPRSVLAIGRFEPTDEIAIMLHDGSLPCAEVVFTYAELMEFARLRFKHGALTVAEDTPAQNGEQPCL